MHLKLRKKLTAFRIYSLCRENQRDTWRHTQSVTGTRSHPHGSHIAKIEIKKYILY